MDWADGFFARLKQKTSLTGHVLDVYGAAINSLAFVISLGIYNYYLFGENALFLFTLFIYPFCYGTLLTKFSNNFIIEEINTKNLTTSSNKSNFKTDIKSYTGRACGISQVIPKYTKPRYTCKELNEDPVIAMEQGARIYSAFKRYARGNDKMNLCAYNQGFRCKGEFSPKHKEIGMEYASKVKKFQKRLKRQIKKEKKELFYKLNNTIWRAYSNIKDLL